MIDRTCPDCRSNSVQSKGYRTAGVHRYLCKNCGRNFTVDTREKQEDISEEISNMNETGKEKANKTLNVTLTTKIRLESVKVHGRETADDIINRLIDNYEATKPQ